MLSTVLILVTLGHADAPHVAFAPAADRAACAARAEALGAVLAGAGYRVAASRCTETAQGFTAYDHGATAFPNAFRLTLPADPDAAATIEPVAALSDCTPARDARAEVICAVSAQAVATP